MSTQPLGRHRRHWAWGSRRGEPSRLVPLLMLSVLAFIAAYVAGYAVQRSGQTVGQGVEAGPSRLPALATSLPSSLSSVPPIEVGVQVVLHAPARTRTSAVSAAGGLASPSTTRRSSSRTVLTPTAGSRHGGATTPRSAGSGAEPGVSFDSSG